MIKLASPDISASDIQKVIDVLESGHLIQGQNVALFETLIASFVDIENAAVVSSCTAALHLSLKALGIKAGDTVIVPAFTFPATASVVENIGADVLMCDVDMEHYVVTPEAIEILIEKNKDKRITAMIVVHAFGYPANMKAISDIAKKHHIKLIEDAACALGTIADGYPVGYFSDAACFSFHPRKALTTGEGGAVVSKDIKIIDTIKLLRNHGIHIVENQVDFIADGLNYRMTDFQAALAIGQMERFTDSLTKRIELATYYDHLLKNQTSLTVPHLAAGHSWQSFMLVLDSAFNRNLVIKQLAEENIQTNLGAQALNCLSYYQKKYGLTESSYPNASQLYKQGLVLPLHGKLTKEDIVTVCAKLSKYLI